MSYREKVKNQPMGTPMDLHFLTGIPYEAPAAKSSPVADMPSDSAIALPFENAVHPGKRRKRRR